MQTILEMGGYIEQFLTKKDLRNVPPSQENAIRAWGRTAAQSPSHFLFSSYFALIRF